jgi:lipoyl(octanoyl) transferase
MAETREPIEWQVARGQVDYAEAVADMDTRAAAIAAKRARERIWLLEHPALYTAGTSADPAELIEARFPVHATGRGGRYTYHGPGQRVGYVQLDLGARGRDVRAYVHALEAWVIRTLSEFGITAFAVPDRIGIWTCDGGREAKIGAIGVRVRRWITLHGFAVNLAPDLSHYGGIVPCGIADFPVTSAETLGKSIAPETFDAALALGMGEFLASLEVRANQGQ